MPEVNFNSYARIKNVVYVYHDILDFSNLESNPIIKIKDGSLELAFPFPKSNEVQFRTYVGQLEYLLFRSDKIVIGWNIKDLITFLTGRLKKELFIGSKIYDLKVLENFCGIDKKHPESFLEAKNRLQLLYKSDVWNKLKTLYSDIHLPLITEVLPSIETTGLANPKVNNYVYPYYEIEGQINGRLRSAKSFLLGFNAHSLGEEEKSYLRPKNFNDMFAYFDFKHMEVTVLQWLSQDPHLSQMIHSGEDLYCAIWHAIAGFACTDEYRAKSKEIFLPVMYGQGPKSLSERLKCDENITLRLIKEIAKEFPKALGWIRGFELKDGNCQDYFGRTRNFGENEQYKARGFLVQSPAALICLHKLVKLYRATKHIAQLVLTIHDGYVLTMDRYQYKEVLKIGKQVLEAEEELFPGLKLKVACKFGNSLNELSEFKQGELC